MTLRVDSTTRRRLALLFAIPLAFSLLFFLANERSQNIDIEFFQLHNLVSSVRTLLSIAKDVELGERSFLLTGDERDLASLKQASAWLPGEINRCRAYARDVPGSKRKVDHVIALVQKRVTQADQVLEEQSANDSAGAIELTRSDATHETMDAIRQSVNDLEIDLNREQSAYLDRQRALNRSTFILFLVGTLIMIVVMAALYNALLHFIQGRDTAQAQLQALNRELEARIDERTLELKQINEELQQFAYVASHDLQEPLRTITSFTQLLADRYRGALDADADEFIGYIVSSSRRMSDLINGLLALVRLRKTGQPTRPVPFEELLEEAKTSLQAAIRESKAQIEHGPLPALMVDRVQFSQLLQNLISNAIKYRREELPRIRVQAKREGGDWIFSVSDNGQGFEQEYAERIFGLFQRLDNRNVDGTGLGLSISRRIVERHRGRIWAESIPGVGSTFFFSLPTSLEAPHEVTRSVANASGVGSAPK